MDNVNNATKEELKKTVVKILHEIRSGIKARDKLASLEEGILQCYSYGEDKYVDIETFKRQTRLLVAIIKSYDEMVDKILEAV